MQRPVAERVVSRALGGQLLRNGPMCLTLVRKLVDVKLRRVVIRRRGRCRHRRVRSSDFPCAVVARVLIIVAIIALVTVVVEISWQLLKALQCRRRHRPAHPSHWTACYWRVCVLRKGRELRSYGKALIL